MHGRLKEMGLLKRPTICIRKPQEQLIKLFIASITEAKRFLDNRDFWLANIVKNSQNHYIFIADIVNPEGFMVIARFKSPLEAEQFKKDLNKLDLGVEITESTILENVLGTLGIRNFMPEETIQYAELKTRGLVTDINGISLENKVTNDSGLKERIDFARLSQ
jgi:hypothetical protein